MRLKKYTHGGIGRGRRRASGQALIEVAIVAPVFFLLLMGSAELARIAYMAIEVANAARAAAQYASQNAGTMSDNQNNNATSNGTAAAASNDAYNMTSLATTATIGYTCSDGTSAATSSTALPSCASGAVALPYVTVTTSAVFNPLIHIPGLPSSFTLSSSATETCVDCQ
jgi:Flp pilus assembly protein TadG